MSDPVTNVEIEDVLSSIRKLVAEETRATPPVRKPAEQDRLVLTPAQRVEEPPKPSEPMFLSERVDAPEEEVTPPDNQPIDDIPGEAKLADYGDIERAFPDADDFDVARFVHVAPDDEEDAPVEAVRGRFELGRLIEQEVASALGASDKDAAATSPDDSDVFHDSDDAVDWEALDVPDSPAHPTEASVADTPASAAPAPDRDIAPTGDATSTPAAPLLTLEDKVAALGRLVARDTGEFEEERDTPMEQSAQGAAEPVAWSQNDHENDDHKDDDPSATAQPDTADDRAAVEEQAEPDASSPWPNIRKPLFGPEAIGRHDPVEKEPEPSPEQPEPSAIDIDEQMLRDLVGDIVRQELQGALGERITRNVRKLVRREIHRMLISQELE
ncbi:hypothetical protein ACG74X_10095 [Marivita sp. S0852]|uniref:hypothetical protein n=1 Tax=Marivita sp. S0852 TaxID=3373893 RepID=UPI003981AF13